MERPLLELAGVVLGSPDARWLAGFYEQLLGWERAVDEPDWVILRPPGPGPGLSFQSEPDHIPPVWPSEPGQQQMMVHLDIGVADLASGVAWAVETGATPATFQPQEDVRVMIDPAGHPFCLFVTGPVGH